MNRATWLLATGNAHKLQEFRRLFGPAGIDIASPADVGGLPEVDETGATFVENARLKAASAARTAGRISLADDSGLCVDALGGAPGVRSARFAGPGADDAANRRLLLERLEGVEPHRRSAHFICVLTLIAPDGRIVAEVEGRTCGRILDAERGEGGFGYDPLFLFDEPGEPASGGSFAELDPSEKDRVSHRGRALRQLLDRLPHLDLGAS